MTHRHFSLVLFALVVITGASARTIAQTNQQLTLTPWGEGAYAETVDRLLFESQSDVRDTGEDANAQVFFWDSTGRVRFDKNDPNAFTLGYRWVNMSFDTNSDVIPDHLDEISLAAGVHLGQLAGGDLGVVLGAGYSGNNPFADDNGLFGVGQLTWRKQLSKTDALAFSVDFNGNSSFLPDVPLPGFAYEHREKAFSFGFGYPDSWVDWKITPELDLSARYEVPYTADATIAYHFTPQVSAFGGVSNFFNGFQIDESSTTNRMFVNMSRAEVGVRYLNPTMWGMFVDASLVVGYAFDQNFYRGFDVRDLEHFASLSDVPYIGIVIVGRF